MNVVWNILLIFAQTKNKMSNDISESVSQRGSGEETPQNRRIHEVADELHRRCQLHETQSGAGQADGGRFEVELRRSSSQCFGWCRWWHICCGCGNKETRINNWKERPSCSFQFFFFHPFLQTRESARVTSRTLHVQPRGVCKRKFECPLSWTGWLKKGGSLISESGSLRLRMQRHTLYLQVKEFTINKEYVGARTGVSTRRYTAGRDAVPTWESELSQWRYSVASIVPATAGTRSSTVIFLVFLGFPLFSRFWSESLFWMILSQILKDFCPQGHPKWQFV